MKFRRRKNKMLKYTYLLVFILSWFISHVVKTLNSLVKKEKNNFLSNFYRSGGMPSAHSATAVSVTTMIGLQEGIDSGLFGLAILVTTIFLYDAMMVRRSSGDQGEALKMIIKETKSRARLGFIPQGHRPVEVLVGSILGFLISVFVFSLK